LWTVCLSLGVITAPPIVSLGQLFFSLEKKRELRVNLMIPPAAAQGSIKKKRQKNGCNYLGLDWQERFLPPPPLLLSASCN
jgi:hypothetical protein